ncbi:hypothetical protein SY88_15850 [Clostridiales bacterium PH28_bin88]|nr:hypothetical protein SY88_15850 [Clostridiales bacterium PH28_bin88]
MQIQITLTVPEAKRLIAKGAAALPEVQAALRNGKIFFKGGTTVSAVAEELVGTPIKISGRISPRGTKTTSAKIDGKHNLLVSSGLTEYVDDRLKQVIGQLGPDDVIIIGANAMDSQGGAAMMLGGALGGPPGEVIAGMLSCGAHVIIPAGLEKFIPGRIDDAVRAAGRTRMDLAMGMAVGLVPLVGRIITEIDALTLLYDVRCTPIGMGGVWGAEGATTMVVAGPISEVKKAFALVQTIKGATTPGLPESFPECERGNHACGNHVGCMYRKGTHLLENSD